MMASYALSAMINLVVGSGSAYVGRYCLVLPGIQELPRKQAPVTVFFI